MIQIFYSLKNKKWRRKGAAPSYTEITAEQSHSASSYIKKKKHSLMITIFNWYHFCRNVTEQNHVIFVYHSVHLCSEHCLRFGTALNVVKLQLLKWTTNFVGAAENRFFSKKKRLRKLHLKNYKRSRKKYTNCFNLIIVGQRSKDRQKLIKSTNYRFITFAVLYTRTLKQQYSDAADFRSSMFYTIISLAKGMLSFGNQETVITFSSYDR